MDSNDVITNLDDEMTTIVNQCAVFDGQYGDSTNLLLPLPPSTDVHAPGYTYGDLRSEDHPPSTGFDVAIRDAATETVPQASAGGSISRALNPDD